MAEPAFDLNNEDGNWDQGPAFIKTSQIRNAKKEVLRTTNQPSNVYSIEEARRKKQTRINTDWDYLENDKLPNNPSTDQIFTAGYRAKGLQPNLNTPTEQRNKKDEGQFKEVTRRSNHLELVDNTKVVSSVESTKDAAKVLKYRSRATTVNISIGAWVGVLWLFVQLPFAILGAIALGLIEVGGVVIVFLNTITGDAITGLYMILYAVVVAVGFISILGASMQYTLANLKPFSGEKSSLKLGMLLLAFIGYSIPLANFFPWVFVFMAAVWIYPK